MTAAASEDILRRIRALKAMTTTRGCTEEEAMTAAALAAKLMREHQVTDDDVEMVKETVAHKYRRGDPANLVLSAIGRCTNTAPLFYSESVCFYGEAPGPEIAVYLKDVCLRAMAQALADFRKTPFYRARRKPKTRQQASRDFGASMAMRISLRLADLYGEVYSEAAYRRAIAHRDSRHPAATSSAMKQKRERFAQAADAGWSAGDRFGLHHGARTAAAPLALPRE